MAGLHFDITGDNSNFMRKLRETEQGVKDTSKQIERSGMSIEDMFSRMTKAATAFGAGFTAKELISNIVKVRGEFQQLEVAFNTMLGSKEKADALMAQMVETAATTPFDLQSVANGAKQLLAYGVAAEDINQTLIRLGDIAAGLSIPLNDLVYLYGTTMSQGHLYTQDFNQFTGRGIPLIAELAKQFGVAESEVRGLVEAGRVGFPEVQKVIESLTDEGGKFGGLMEAQSKTISGQISNIGDSISMMFNEIGQANEGVINDVLGTASSLVENYEQVGKVLLSLVAIYGTYKVAVMTVAALQSLQASGIAALTAAERAHYGWLVLTAKAQRILNATMLANPYVLVATSVTALGIALLNSANNADKCQKGIDAYNRSVEESAKKTSEHKAEIEALLSVAQDEQSSTDDRREALIRLEQQYPDIFKQYKTEADMLRDILNIKKLINEEDKHRKQVADEEELQRLNAEIDKINEAIKLASKSGAGLSVQSLVNERNNLVKQRDLKQEEVNKKKYDEILSDLSGYSNGQLEGEIKVRELLLKRLENAQKLGKNLRAGKVVGGILPGIKSSNQLQSEKQAMERVLNSRNQGQTTYQQDLVSAKADWEKAKKGYEAILKDQKATSKQVREAREKMEATEKTYKGLGGITGSKSQATKQENTISQQKDRISELERKNATDRIRQQEDLENKVAQSRIDAMDEGFEKEKAQMELNHKKELQEIGRQRQDYVNAVIQMEKEAFDAKEKLKASNDKNYKPKAFDSSTVSVDTSAFDIMGKEARERQKMEIADFYKDSLSEYQDYITKYNSTREKFAKERDRYKKAGASDTQLKEIDYQEQETLKAIDNEFAAREESFNSWADSVIDLSIEKLRELLNQAYQEMMNMEISDPNNPDLAVKRAKVATLRNALEKKEIEKEVSPGKSIKDWDKLYKVLTDVNDVFEEIGDTVGGTFGEIISLAGGIASSSLQAVGAIKGIGEAASGLEKASGILAAISAGMKIISGIGGFFKEKFGADYSEYDALKSQYETLIGIWDQLIGKKMEYIDIDYGIEAQKAADEAAKLVNIQIERQRQLIKQLASSGSSAGSHSLGYRINDRLTAEDYERISGLVGEKITAEYQLWDLSSEQMEKLLTDERLVSVLGEVNGEFIEYIQNIADYGNQLEEIAQKEKEALTGIGLDEFKSGYVDLLSDLDSTNEEFADNFEKYLQNAIFSSLIANKYKDEIESLYDQWAADSESGGRLTSEEAERLRQEQKELTEQMLADREQLMNDFGWEPSGGTSAQQASSAVKVQASQESVDETNGRLTAIQEIQSQILNSLSLLSNLNSNVVSINNLLSEIRNLSLSSNGYLFDIQKCSKSILIQFSEKLDSIIKSLS